MILRIRILDLLLYWDLNDFAWKMTKLETTKSGQMTATFEPKKGRYLAYSWQCNSTSMLRNAFTQGFTSDFKYWGTLLRLCATAFGTLFPLWRKICLSS